MAVFAMHPEAESRPASAVAVTLLHTGEAEVEDLHDPTNFYRVRLPVPPPVPDR